MASSDATPFPIKNQAYRVTFPILDADGDLVAGATGLDSEISKDGGTFVDCTNEATEIATSSGMYFLDLTNTEMNADTVSIIVKTSSSGAKTTPIVMYPVEDADIPVNVKQVNGTAQTANDNGADINTILVDTNEIQGKLPTNKFMGSSDGADDDGTLNTIDTNAARLTAVRAAVLTDLIDGNRLDLLIDAILLDTGTTLETLLTDVKGATFSGATDSLEAIRNRGDAAWAGAPESVSGTIAVSTADTVFDLTATLGTLSIADDTYNNMIICILDNSGNIYETARITDYDGTGLTRVTIDHELTFPVQNGVDTFVIYRAAYAPVGAASITEGDKNDIAGKVWDIDTKTSHQTKDTSGYFMRRSGGRF